MSCRKMKLLRSRKMGCLVILMFLIQLSLLYWVIHDFVYDPRKLPEVTLEAREDGGKEPIYVDHPSNEKIISPPHKLTPNPPSNTQSRADLPLQEIHPSQQPQTQKITKKPPSSPSPPPSSSSVTTPQTVYWTGSEQLAEKSNRSPRKLNSFEAKGNNILFTIRTTQTFHEKRLPVLFETWINKVNGSNFFLVTDGDDEEYERKTREHGMHYVKVSCGKSYGRWSLCCKSGEEMSLMHRPENLHYDWFCHMDDDIYIIHDNLVKLLSIYDPRNESVYIGRAGSYWQFPRTLQGRQSLIDDPNKNLKFHFAVGGLYCLSRPLLNKVKPWLGDGKTMGSTCDKLLEPEDVAVAATVELLAHERLSRTHLFHPHGLILSKVVNPATIKQQVGFAYGCGQLCGYKAYNKNAIQVPNAAFPFEQDPSRFKSIYCHLYPDEELCKR